MSNHPKEEICALTEKLSNNRFEREELKKRIKILRRIERDALRDERRKGRCEQFGTNYLDRPAMKREIYRLRILVYDLSKTCGKTPEETESMIGVSVKSLKAYKASFTLRA